MCKGMIADIAMHEGVASDGGKNPHAHIMLTMRDLLEDGSGFDKKNRTWNETHQLEEWRENWAKAANGYIEDFNKQAELSTEQVAPIDHRSYAEQGLELQPTQHMGKEATALEKQGIETDIGKANRVIEHVNRAVLFARASMASARDYAVEFYSQMKERVQVSARTLEHSEIQHVQIAGLAWNEEKEHEIGDYER